MDCLGRECGHIDDHHPDQLVAVWVVPGHVRGHDDAQALATDARRIWVIAEAMKDCVRNPEHLFAMEPSEMPRTDERIVNDAATGLRRFRSRKDLPEQFP